MILPGVELSLSGSLCVDWTERRLHIGGAIGAALARRCFELKWIERARDSRALTVTAAGRRGVMEVFGLSTQRAA